MSKNLIRSDGLLLLEVNLVFFIKMCTSSCLQGRLKGSRNRTNLIRKIFSCVIITSEVILTSVLRKGSIFPYFTNREVSLHRICIRNFKLQNLKRHLKSFSNFISRSPTEFAVQQSRPVLLFPGAFEGPEGGTAFATPGLVVQGAEEQKPENHLPGKSKS